MRAESRNHKSKEKEIYAREFHPVRDNETILAYDVENVRIIQLNDLESRVLNNIKEKSISISELKKRLPDEKGDKIEETVNELINVDMLGYLPFKKISREEIAEFERKNLENMKKEIIKQVSLNISHRCNLQCDYCFGEDGSYGGPAIHMSRDTAEKAVDFLLKESGDSEGCRITFFGGEPLLNFDLIKYVVPFARKKAAKFNKTVLFNMTTNGVLLNDHIIDFLIKEKIDVTFSFDGPRHIHDTNRRFKTNKEKSTYDLIYPKILKFIEMAKKNNVFYAFRGTLTRPGIINMDELIDFYKNLNTKEVYFDTAEYKNGISRDGLAITDEDLNIYRQKVKNRAERFMKNKSKDEFNIFSKMLKIMKDKIRKSNFCVSPGVLYVCVSAEGDIYPCHRFVGHKKTKLGNIWQGFDREKWLAKFAKVHIYNSKVCSRCWVRYSCGGLCPATNYYLGEDMVLSENVAQEPVHCKLKKIIFEESMLLFARLDEEDLEAVAHAEAQDRHEAFNALRN
jgi:uncharacterized protein